MLALYIPWLNRGFNNYEDPFVFAGRALAFTSDSNLINAYFGTVANPLGYSLTLSSFYRVFGFNDGFWFARLPALLGALLVLLSGWLITKSIWHEKQHFFYIWVTLLVLQPMFMVFSTSGTADILPVGLLMFSIALAVASSEKKLAHKLLVGAIFGFAVIVKYNTAYFGLALVAAAFFRSPLSMWKKYEKIRDVLIYVLVPGIFLSAYLYWSYSRYGVLISSRLGLSQPNFFDVISLTKNFVKYLSFFGLFLGFLPLTRVIVKCRSSGSILKWFGFAVLLIPIGWFSSGNYVGEMNQGLIFGTRYQIFFRLIETLGFVMGVFCLVCVTQISKLNLRIKVALLSGFISYLFLISATYPSQRYLTFVIPGVLLLLTDAMRVLSKRMQILTIGLTVIVFASTSLLGLSYLTGQGNASEKMAVWVEENNLLPQTSSSVIWPHAGQHFWGVKRTDLRYEVVAVTPTAESRVTERVLHREPMKVLGRVTRVYLLTEIGRCDEWCRQFRRATFSGGVVEE